MNARGTASHYEPTVFPHLRPMILRYHPRPLALPQLEVVPAFQNTLNCIWLIRCRITISVLVELPINHLPNPVHVNFVGPDHRVDQEPAFLQHVSNDRLWE